MALGRFGSSVPKVASSPKPQPEEAVGSLNWPVFTLEPLLLSPSWPSATANSARPAIAATPPLLCHKINPKCLAGPARAILPTQGSRARWALGWMWL